MKIYIKNNALKQFSRWNPIAARFLVTVHTTFHPRHRGYLSCSLHLIYICIYISPCQFPARNVFAGDFSSVTFVLITQFLFLSIQIGYEYLHSDCLSNKVVWRFLQAPKVAWRNLFQCVLILLSWENDSFFEWLPSRVKK